MAAENSRRLDRRRSGSTRFNEAAANGRGKQGNRSMTHLKAELLQ